MSTKIRDANFSGEKALAIIIELLFLPLPFPGKPSFQNIPSD